MMRRMWAMAAVLLGAGVVRAGRPLVTDDAYPVSKGSFELEAGFLFTADGRDRSYDVPVTLTYGLTSNLEVGVGVAAGIAQSRTVLGWDSADGFSDVVVGTKWQFAEADRLLLDQSLSFAVRLPTASEAEGLSTGEVDFSALWIGSRKLTEKLHGHVNVGFHWRGDPGQEEIADLFHYGLAADYHLTEQIQPVLEFFGEIPMEGEDGTRLFINGGVRWSVIKNLVLDAAVGTTVHGEGPDVFATAGLTWTF